MQISISIWGLIMFFVSTGLLTLGAVALGGYLVYQAKRDSHEPLFSIQRREDNQITQEDPYVIPDVERQLSEIFMPRVHDTPSVPPVVLAQNERMKEQMMKEEV